MKFTIKGRLNSLNEYVNACRSGFYAGNCMKKKNQAKVTEAFCSCNLEKVTNYPVLLHIEWYEKDKRRDIDNIVFATKFIQDSLVVGGILENDSQRFISSIEHLVVTDKTNPRIEVSIIELNESKGDSNGRK